MACFYSLHMYASKLASLWSFVRVCDVGDTGEGATYQIKWVLWLLTPSMRVVRGQPPNEIMSRLLNRYSPNLDRRRIYVRNALVWLAEVRGHAWCMTKKSIWPPWDNYLSSPRKLVSVRTIVRLTFLNAYCLNSNVQKLCARWKGVANIARTSQPGRGHIDQRGPWVHGLPRYRARFSITGKAPPGNPETWAPK